MTIKIPTYDVRPFVRIHSSGVYFASACIQSQCPQTHKQHSTVVLQQAKFFWFFHPLSHTRNKVDEGKNAAALIITIRVSVDFNPVEGDFFASAATNELQQ